MAERKGRKVTKVPKPKRIGTKSRKSESERKERRLAKANKEADKERRSAKRKAVSKKKTSWGGLSAATSKSKAKKPESKTTKVKKVISKSPPKSKPSDLSIEKLRSMSRNLPGYKSVKRPGKEYEVTFQSGSIPTVVYIGFIPGPDKVYDNNWHVDYDVLCKLPSGIRHYDNYTGRQHTPGIKAVLERASEMDLKSSRAEKRGYTEGDVLAKQIREWKKRRRRCTK